MVVNFRARRISRDTRKLVRTPTLNSKKKKRCKNTNNNRFISVLKHVQYFPSFIDNNKIIITCRQFFSYERKQAYLEYDYKDWPRWRVHTGQSR
jgi:hypothetical protein